MDIRQGLIDCGCGKSQYDAYSKLKSSGEKLRFLRTQRKNVMDDLHTAQKRVDCIDFLIKEVEKEAGIR